MVAKSENRKRVKTLTSRCLPAEFAAVQKRAKMAGYAHLATFIRDACLGVERALQIEGAPVAEQKSGALEMTPEIEALLKAMDQNARTGANLNQLAAHLNRAREDIRAPILLKLEKRVLEILEQVQENQATLKELLGR